MFDGIFDIKIRLVSDDHVSFWVITRRDRLVISVSVSNAVGRGFAPLPGYTFDFYKNGTNCLSFWHCNCIKCRIVCGTVHRDMNYKHLRPIVKVWCCIPESGFYLVLSTLINQSFAVHFQTNIKYILSKQTITAKVLFHFCTIHQLDINILQIYMKSVSKTASLIRPGGRLVMAGVLGESYYCFQDKKFFCLKLSKDDVEEALAQAGLSLQDWRHVEYAHASCDVAALFCLTALKMTWTITAWVTQPLPKANMFNDAHIYSNIETSIQSSDV